MRKKLFSILIVTALSCNYSYSQDKESNFNNFSNLDLKEKMLTSETAENKPEINTSITASKKSPAIALLLSLVLPGSGHYYLDRMDVGKYFLGADAVGWIGLVTMNVYGNSVQDDARSYSAIHADITNPGSQDDDFYTNIGSYNSVYEYNNAKLSTGEYNSLYSTSANYWDWDNINNRNFYNSQRKQSERIYNNRIVFSSLLIVNRIVAGISAYLIGTNIGKKSTSMNISPELLYKKDLSIDGFLLSLNKNF